MLQLSQYLIFTISDYHCIDLSSYLSRGGQLDGVPHQDGHDGVQEVLRRVGEECLVRLLRGRALLDLDRQILEVANEVEVIPDLEEDPLGLAEQLGAVGAAVARDGVDERLAGGEVDVHLADGRDDLSGPVIQKISTLFSNFRGVRESIFQL